MRNFTLNEERVDLANNKAIMGVGPCFRVVEPGVYFPGMGYAIYSEYTMDNASTYSTRSPDIFLQAWG